MTRPRLPLLLVMSALCFLVQGALLLWSTRHVAAPELHAPWLFLALGALSTGGFAVALLRDRGRRWRAFRWPGRLLLLMGLFAHAALLVSVVGSLQRTGRDDEHWQRRNQARLTEIVDKQARLIAGIDPALDALIDSAVRLAATADVFDLTATLHEAWARQFPVPDRYPLNVVLWRAGERIAWNDDANPFAAPAMQSSGVAGHSWREVERGRTHWYLRTFVVLHDQTTTGELLELQLRLVPLGSGSPRGRSRSEARSQLWVEMAAGTGVSGPLWRGNARHGVQLSHEVPLGRPDATGERQHMRITYALPPRQVVDKTQAARALMVFLVLWSVAGLGWGRLSGRDGHLVLACWVARGLLAAVDFFRWIPPAYPDQRMPALSSEAASLADPAYFATPFAGGWFASAADGLLTAVLVAGTVLYLARGSRRLWPRRDDVAPAPSNPRDATGTGRRRFYLAIVFAVLTGLVLLGLRQIVVEVADNANARLIGPQLSFRFLTFWALHTVIFLLSGSALVLLMATAMQLRRHCRFSLGGPVIALILLTISLLISGVSWPVRLTMLVIGWLVWWYSPRLPVTTTAARGLVFTAALALTVLWNYAVLREVYERAERSWLQRKAEQIVQPRDEWIRYLLEDVLREMPTRPEVSRSPSVAAGPGAQLWPHETAYQLWQDSAIRDLGLPCLVEIIDDEGYSESLFASGFLRDFGYEVRERSEWRDSATAGGEDELPIVTQREVRRYPTGEERILRGEVMLPRGDGWLRVELPVQSKRISSLLDWLAGAEVLDGEGGYRPRAEVDRPLLLLRGDRAGWLDAGPGGFPDVEAGEIIDRVRSGGRVWDVVEVDGDRFRCLWAPLSDEAARARDEGFLLGLAMLTPAEILLDLSRLYLLDVALLVVLAPVFGVWRPHLRKGRWRRPGFQRRFLAAYLALGLLLLLMAGLAVDRLSLQRIDSEARNQTRDGMTTAMAQLQSLLAEQATALAESEYIADLLANRLAGDRPLGPFAVQQGMIFADDGRLLLDETLSDLDEDEAAVLLQIARTVPLVMMADRYDLYLGTVIPIDLSAVRPASDTTEDPAAPGGRDSATGSAQALDNGFFFYRQRVDSDMMVGLAEIIQGEVTLLLGGELVLTSNQERVFAGRTPLLAPPSMMRRLVQRPVNPFLHAAGESRLAFTGCISLPAVVIDAVSGQLRSSQVPAALTVDFPDRERDLARQREQTVLFLAGLATLILLTALLLALVMSATIFGPLQVLLTATRRLAGGDYFAPLPDAGADEVGQLAGSFGAMRDELHSARERLATRERFLTTVLDRVPVGVAVFDADGEVVVLNPVGEQIVADFYPGKAGRVASAKRLLEAFDALAWPPLTTEGESATAAEPPTEAELPSENGRRTLRGRTAPLHLPDGRRDTMLVFEDVTEFLANQRLALNAELARQVAHEIKNPLTPIQLSIQLLHQAYCDGAPELDRIVEDTVRRVLEQVTLLRSIATEFSLLGRPGDLECAALDLPALLDEVVARYHANSRQDVQHTVSVTVAPAEVPPVLAHADSLSRVLGNLMQNSLDAVSEDGRLEISVDWRIEPDTVTMIWLDNGMGLTSEVADRLFDPYFSTKSKGTGLGLAICRNLLDKMQGGITLENRSDTTGAVAELMLPRFRSA